MKEAIVLPVGLTPNIRALRTIREQRGLNVSAVAAFASISPDRLAAFEQGDRKPSRKQMEKLAETYGVPLYSLFGDALPNLPPLPQDFRKRVPAPASLSPRGIRTLLAAERVSGFARQLAIELDYQATDLSRAAKRAKTAKRRATELRAAFDEWLAPREARLSYTGTNEQRFMGALRLFFEVQGGVLNINDAPADDFMGFFVEPDSGLPTIFVNRAVSSKKAQLFTLAHEYSHALLGEDGISNPFAARNEIERTCNVFAAEFLAPMDRFAAVVEALPRDVRGEVISLIDATSLHTLLSKHASAIRLVEGSYISESEFRSWRGLFTANPRQEKDEETETLTSGSGAPHAKRIGELGYLPIILAKRAIDERMVDPFDVEEELGLSRTLQKRAFALASRRFEAALS